MRTPARRSLLRFRFAAAAGIAAAWAIGALACGSPPAPAATGEIRKPVGSDKATKPTTTTAATSSAGWSEQELRTRLDALVETRNHKLGLPQSPVIVDAGRAALYLRGAARDSKLALYIYLPSSGREELVASAANMAGDDAALPEAERRMRERMRVTTRGISSFSTGDDGAHILINLGGRLFWHERATKTNTLLAIAAGAVAPQVSPDGKLIGYVRDNSVWLYDLASKRERRVTEEGREERSFGQAEFVAQEELDRTQGFWFSPNSRELLIQLTDNRKVEKLTTSDPGAPEGAAEPRYYPRAGKANAQIEFYLYNLQGPLPQSKPKLLPLDLANYPYVAHVVWPKDAPLTFVALDRAQQNLEAWIVQDNKPRTLLRVHDAAWINADNALPIYLDHGRKFLWASEAPNSPRLELRNVLANADQSGLYSSAVAPVVAAHNPHIENVFVDQAETHAYYTSYATGLSGYMQRATLAAGASGEVPGGSKDAEAILPGIHIGAAKPNKAGTHLLALEHPEAAPPRWRLRDLSGASSNLASEAERLPIQIESATPANIRYLQIGSAKYQVAIVRPTRALAGVRLPIVDAIYGGPHVNTVNDNTWNYLRSQWIADATGAAVVAIDVQGTPRRGRDFERATYLQFGSLPMQQHVQALQALAAAEPDLDIGRVGVYGWSFGGYLAARAALEYPNFFRAAVSGAPPVDWLDYDTCYTERYLGMPDANGGASYATQSLLALAAKPAAIAPLLLLHGTKDDNVYFSQSLKLANALFRAHKRFEFVPLLSTTHLLYEPKLTAEVWLKTAAFLRENLHARTENVAENLGQAPRP